MTWISVSERLPEVLFPYGVSDCDDGGSYDCSENVLIATATGIHIAHTSRWDDNPRTWVLAGRDSLEITGVLFWMPLPEHPKPR